MTISKTTSALRTDNGPDKDVQLKTQFSLQLFVTTNPIPITFVITGSNINSSVFTKLRFKDVQDYSSNFVIVLLGDALFF